MKDLSKLELYALKAPEVPQWFIDFYVVDRSKLPEKPTYTEEQETARLYYLVGPGKHHAPFTPKKMSQLMDEVKAAKQQFERDYKLAVYTQREIAWRRYFATEIMRNL